MIGKALVAEYCSQLLWKKIPQTSKVSGLVQKVSDNRNMDPFYFNMKISC